MVKGLAKSLNFFNPNYGKGRSDRPITGSWIVQADLDGPIEIPLI
jgi:hypothetical protein